MPQNMGISRDAVEHLFLLSKNNTKYADRILNTIGYADVLEEGKKECMENVILKEGFFCRNISGK